MSHTLTPEQQVAYNKLVEVSPPSPAEPAWHGFIYDDDTFIGMGIEQRWIFDKLRESPMLAVDCETSGTGNADRWKIHCVTMSDGQVALVLNPRVVEEYAAIYELLSMDKAILFHNAPFDVPILVAWKLAPEAICDRVFDTIILARLMPQLRNNMTLGALAERYLGINDVSLNVAYSSVSTKRGDWFQIGDIDRLVYAKSAARDTAVCFRLNMPLLDAACEWLTTGARNLTKSPKVRSEAQAIITEIIQASQAMLHLQCAGLGINTDAVQEYRAQAQDKLDKATAILDSLTVNSYTYKDGQIVRRKDKNGNYEPPHTLRHGNSEDVVNYLAEAGLIDCSGWPRTASGRLSGDKKQLEKVRDQFEVVDAHITYSEVTKVMDDYLGKFEDLRHPLTGKIYPQIGTLGAVSTGRQSASNPPIQQIPADARPMISTGDETWVSIDWTSVEPMLASYCAGEKEVYESVLGGGDLYIPIARKAGLIPPDVDDIAAHDHKGRKHAKVILLMLLYGGGAGALAKSLGVPVDEATKLRDSVLRALPHVREWSRVLVEQAEKGGAVVTIAGRVLPVDKDSTYRAVNYFHQGSAADLLIGVLAECQRRGIAHGLRITVHDEIVCTTEVAAEVQDIMAHHNPAMLRFLGRQVTFPTDAHVLEKHWAAV